MLARGLETLKYLYNHLIPMGTNVEKLFARGLGLKSPRNNFILLATSQKKCSYHDIWKHFNLHTTF